MGKSSIDVALCKDTDIDLSNLFVAQTVLWSLGSHLNWTTKTVYVSAVQLPGMKLLKEIILFHPPTAVFDAHSSLSVNMGTIKKWFRMKRKISKGKLGTWNLSPSVVRSKTLIVSCSVKCCSEVVFWDFSPNPLIYYNGSLLIFFYGENVYINDWRTYFALFTEVIRCTQVSTTVWLCQLCGKANYIMTSWCI